jgi:UDP-N-acetylmuramoyl-tripeptide--D-alanyl-D-alanine ligase
MFHAEAGRFAKAKGIEGMLTVGELAQVTANAFEGARHFESVEKLVDVLLNDLPHLRSVLVKGSRFMRMERVVDALMGMVASAPAQEERRHAG